MYAIKQDPSDFFVEEIPTFQEQDFSGGEYGYFSLSKRNLGTMEAIALISKRLRIRVKDVGFAGNKDKRAVTQQMISVKGFRLRKDYSAKDFMLIYLGNGRDPINLGSLHGNKFRIVVRNLSEREAANARKRTSGLKIVPNYFGEQRFSTHNVEIGRLLVKKEFRKAVETYISAHGADVEVSGAFRDNASDPIGALRLIPKKLLKLFVHAYQSWIFNEVLKKYVVKRAEDLDIPLVGFSTELGEFDADIAALVETIMAKEKIGFRDFIIRQIPDLTAEGDTRKVYMSIEDLKMGKLEKDDLNKGKVKCELTFSLCKNSYATVVVDYLFLEEATTFLQ